jgi:RNA polymerase sigma-70 factor, ECF subfamily
MPGGHDDTKIAQAYLEHRPYLVDLAFRMLGDVGAAEDAVQDAFARLVRSGPGDIEDERGWLIVVTSRLCLDQIRSARSRRELASDPGQIEAVASPAGELADPADRVTFDDSVRLALLVVLQRLTPAERVVLVLHDVFQVPFDAVAEATGKTVPACRQLATRARRKIAEHGTASLTVTAAEHRRVTEKFITAAGRGDLDGLVEVLAPDAWGDVDYGPGVAIAHPVVTGALRVARNLLRFWGPTATLVSFPGGAHPAVLGFIGRELHGILVLNMRGERIQGVHVIADPAALDFLAAQLAVTFDAASPSLPVPPRNRRR